MPLTLPTQADSNVTVGGVGYMYLQQAKDVSGAALGTPDTWHKVSKIAPISFNRKALSSTINKVFAKSNAFGEQIYPVIALDLSNSNVSTQPPDLQITTAMIESSLAHLQFYDTVRGVYFYCLLPLGSHGGQKVSWVGFVEIEDGGKVDIDPSKATEIPLTINIMNNTVSITPNMTGFTDANVGVIAPVIAINAGFVWVGV